MSHPGYQPRHGGAAGVALAAASRRLEASGRPAFTPAPPPRLSAEQREQAVEAITSGAACRLCAGIHPGDELACPRLASFRLDGDGRVTEGTFWADGAWDASLVIRASDIAEEEADG